MTNERVHRVGDRVVISYHRREIAATIVAVGKVGYLVMTDIPYEGESRQLQRSRFELYDTFDNGAKP